MGATPTPQAPPEKRSPSAAIDGVREPGKAEKYTKCKQLQNEQLSTSPEAICNFAVVYDRLGGGATDGTADR